jgi:Fe-S oxidoreductase
MIASKTKDFSDGKSLISDYVTEEEIYACTSCNACVEACPINISPVEIIIDLRRYLVMEKGISPREWTVMFSNTENNYAPWAFNPEDRSKWTNELG